MELYYYDKRDKQFYSTFITDYKAYNLLRELAGNS
ncbi:hypothetical protein HNQ91_002517 [Filimonas zeae]|nr:hypothetical protein [Filimonas zeae]